MRVPWLWSHGMVGVGPMLFLPLRLVLSLRCTCVLNCFFVVRVGQALHVNTCGRRVWLLSRSFLSGVWLYSPPLAFVCVWCGSRVHFGEGFLHVPPL